MIEMIVHTGPSPFSVPVKGRLRVAINSWTVLSVISFEK